ncbi:MAG: hypothetical protein Q8P64_02675 [Deltaproteobacteria bacterium]|nr:hypothetical protein [Deltaproteobacteria bacterium]
MLGAVLAVRLWTAAPPFALRVRDPAYRQAGALSEPEALLSRRLGRRSKGGKRISPF